LKGEHVLSLTITKVPQLLPIYQASNEIEGKGNADFVYSLHIGQTLFFIKVQVKIKAKQLKHSIVGYAQYSFKM
jgi:hypothetical protein